MLPFGAALAAKCMKKKVIYHIHETSIRPKFLKKFLKFNIKLCASKIIFVSNYLQKQEEINTIPQTVIYNAIEAIPLTSLSRNDNHFLVLMVCSLKLFKGIKEFITIASDTESYNYIQYQLILNASPTEIKSFFKTLDVTKNVTIVPRQIDLSPFYKKANLLINLSRPDEWIETFGLTLIEGMQYGLPCIGPCEGGPKEIICDQKDGYLISCYDKNKIIETILKLANDSNLYHRLSTNAMEKVKKFDFSTFKKNIMKELDSIQLS
jgi:glycosyltransferase involved in cell wall biosynthesis